MKKTIKTEMLKSYMGGFLLRVFIFLGIAILYFWQKPVLERLIRQPISMGITPIHILWFMWMLIMISHLFPSEKMTMALRKKQGEKYEEVKDYSELELLRFVQDQNVKAWIVLLLWLSFNAIFGVLYLVGILDNTDLIMLTVFYFLCDYICILFYCPFQTEIMKNKCCVNCRIFDWGHFMMFTPMLFIKNFFSWSLFFTACVVLLKWEITYAKHPERFWRGSNNNLKCENCKDKICQLKKKLANQN